MIILNVTYKCKPDMREEFLNAIMRDIKALIRERSQFIKRTLFQQQRKDVVEGTPQNRWCAAYPWRFKKRLLSCLALFIRKQV